MSILITSDAYRRCKIRAACTNGCGPKGWGWAVPDKLCGLSIAEACNRHDCRYQRGRTDQEKIRADSEFLANMLILIDSAGDGFLIACKRKAKAYFYYLAVRYCGWKAYKSKQGMCK